MKCEDFGMLLPDAVGEELSEGDRADFERHLAECTTCRREHESLRATVSEARSLPLPRHVSVQRIGDRLILSESPMDRRTYGRSWLPSAFRYAASILLAFAAGYALHGTSSRRGVNPLSDDGSPGKTVQVAFANAHLRNPQSSDLTKGMMAVWARN